MDAQGEVLLTSKRFRVVRKAHHSADGQTHVRDVVEHPGSVVILPLLDDGRVCLIRNRRVAVNATLVELPAGTLEGNSPLATARRELIEETGYRAQAIEPLLEFFVSPGILNERMHLFVATGLTPGEAELEPGEEIERLEVPWAEALDMIEAGTIKDAKTLIGLLYYDRWKRA